MVQWVHDQVLEVITGLVTKGSIVHSNEGLCYVWHSLFATNTKRKIRLIF